MPPDRVRSSNVQGRQKSCSECAKSKRKCDLQQPNCRRCTRQRLTCTYPSRLPSQSLPSDTDLAPTVDNAEDLGLIESLFDPQLDLSFDLGMPDATAPTDLELLEPVQGPSGTMNNLGHTEESLGDFVRREVAEIAERAGRYPSAKSISNLVASELFESRVGYSMEQWKLAPRMMVERNCTPWSHPNLYEELMPRSMQDAFAACSLYICRTKTNAKFVLRHITERARELVEQPIPMLPAETVARAQAALLYQVMLISSDDYQYYHQTRALLAHLKELSNCLYSIVNEDGTKNRDHDSTLPLYPSAAARAAWLSYIFRESCRRTHLAVCHAVSICTLLQGDMVACNDAIAIGNRVTISATLWEAKSPLEFAVAWNEKNHYLVRDLDFSEVLRSADVEDVDNFGRMIMVGLMGADDVKGWLHSKGGKL